MHYSDLLSSSAWWTIFQKLYILHGTLFILFNSVSEANELICHVALLRQEGPSLKSKGKASGLTRIAVLTWRSLLVMSREWKYYWLRLILYMLLAVCIGTVFSGLGHSLSSVVVSFLFYFLHSHYKFY